MYIRAIGRGHRNDSQSFLRRIWEPDLRRKLPRFNFFDMSAPIFSRPRFLPGSKINGAQIDHAVIADGCIINHARISNSVVGLRTIIENNTELNRVVTLGSDYYESHEMPRAARKGGTAASGHRCKLPRLRTLSLIKMRALGTTVTISAPLANRRTTTTNSTSSATAYHHRFPRTR